MRKTTLALNSVVVAFFACFVAYTFFARLHLESLAREFVTEKTLNYAQPVVEVADEAIDSPLVNKVLSDEKAKVIRGEIAHYRSEPRSYIEDLTGPHVRDAPVPKANPMLKQVTSIKDRIRTFYADTLDALIIDIRIFSISNLVAGIIAFGLAYRSPHADTSIVWFSFLMFAAVLCCSYLYIDDLTFFRILFRTHMGWWYPALLCAMMVALYLDYGRHAKATEPGNGPPSPISRFAR